VAPRPGNLAKKLLPKRRAEVLRFGACLDFFFFPFRRGNLFRTEVTDFSRGIFVLFSFSYFYQTLMWLARAAMAAARLSSPPEYHGLLRGPLIFLVR
jgi:hypothetical protein